MKWSDAYATGISHIDDQHRMIFQMAEDYRTSVEAGEGRTVYGLFLEFLDRYIRSHFEFEEQCMAQYHCPAAARNKAAHAELIEVVADYRKRYQAEGFQPQQARSLVDTIDGWLASHICGIDVQLKDFVQTP